MSFRVLHVAYQSAKIGGGEVILSQLAKGAAAAGREVRAALPSPGPLEAELAAAGIGTDLVPMGSSVSPGTVRRLRALFKRNTPCIVHSHGLLRNLPCRLARAGLPGVALVNHCHLVRNLPFGPFGTPRSFLPRLLVYMLYDNATAFLADRIACVSEAIRDDLARQGVRRDRLRILPNGVAPPALSRPEARARISTEFALPDDAFAVAAIARLDINKGAPELVRTAMLCCREDPAWRFVLFGEGFLRQELTESIRTAGLADRVHLPGYRPDARDLLPGFDASICASRAEGFGLAPLEAVAAGVPPVVSAHPVFREVLGDACFNHLSAPMGDPAAFAARLAQVRADPAAAARLVELAAERWRAGYTLAAMTEGWLTLYRELDGVLHARLKGYG